MVEIPELRASRLPDFPHIATAVNANSTRWGVCAIVTYRLRELRHLWITEPASVRPWMVGFGRLAASAARGFPASRGDRYMDIVTAQKAVAR